MPLIQRDPGRASTSENRRSFVDYLELETNLTENASAPQPPMTYNMFGGDSVWRWEQRQSPETAQSPGSVVATACFPPSNASAFTSYSETARPGYTGWGKSTAGFEITDIVASLNNMSMSSSNDTREVHSTVQMQLNYDINDNKQQTLSLRRRDQNYDVMQSALTLPSAYRGIISSPDSSLITWAGDLPKRNVDPSSGFSSKVFLGGLPWDISESALMHALRHFQPIRVEWPGREPGGGGAPRGYAYVTLQSERSVLALLAASRYEEEDWYYRIASRKIRSKEVQVIPWSVADSSWMCGDSTRLQLGMTVFVGALHGMISAAGLAYVMDDIFGNVVYTGIDTDKNKYPIGSGRVMFSSLNSYLTAVSAAFVEISTTKFKKKLQVDPYLEDSMCGYCNLRQGPYFCKDPDCFRYLCRMCWGRWHCTSEMSTHVPLMRKTKGTTKHPPPHRYSLPADHSVELLYNAVDAPPTGGTPSRSTSATSATSGTSGTSAFSEASGSKIEQEEAPGWLR